MVALASRAWRRATAACWLHVGLERAALQHGRAGRPADLGAFGEQALLEEGGHAGEQIDPVDRLDAADELAALGDRLAAHRGGADRRRAAAELRMRRDRGQQGQQQRSQRERWSGRHRRIGDLGQGIRGTDGAAQINHNSPP